MFGVAGEIARRKAAEGVVRRPLLFLFIYVALSSDFSPLEARSVVARGGYGAGFGFASKPMVFTGDCFFGASQFYENGRRRAPCFWYMQEQNGGSAGLGPGFAPHVVPGFRKFCERV